MVRETTGPTARHIFITSGEKFASANVAIREMSSGVKWMPPPDTAGEDASMDALAFFVGGSDDILMF